MSKIYSARWIQIDFFFSNLNGNRFYTNVLNKSNKSQEVIEQKKKYQSLVITIWPERTIQNKRLHAPKSKAKL